jgi:hypothetical protein
MAAFEEAATSCQFRLRLNRCPVDVEVQDIEVEALLRLKRLFHRAASSDERRWTRLFHYLLCANQVGCWLRAERAAAVTAGCC